MSLISLAPVHAATATYEFKFISDNPSFGEIGSGSLNLNFIPQNVTLNLQSILNNAQGSYKFEYIAFCAPGICENNNGGSTGATITDGTNGTLPLEERINFSGQGLARYIDQLYDSAGVAIPGARDTGEIQFALPVQVQVPEPGTVVSLGILGLGLVVVRKNRRK